MCKKMPKFIKTKYSNRNRMRIIEKELLIKWKNTWTLSVRFKTITTIIKFNPSKITWKLSKSFPKIWTILRLHINPHYQLIPNLKQGNLFGEKGPNLCPKLTLWPTDSSDLTVSIKIAIRIFIILIFHQIHSKFRFMTPNVFNQKRLKNSCQKAYHREDLIDLC